MNRYENVAAIHFQFGQWKWQKCTGSPTEPIRSEPERAQPIPWEENHGLSRDHTSNTVVLSEQKPTAGC